MSPQTAVALAVLFSILGIFFGVCTCCVVRQWVCDRCGGEIYPATAEPVRESDLPIAAEVARRNALVKPPEELATTERARAPAPRHCIVVQPGLSEGDDDERSVAVAVAIAIPDNICAYGNGSGSRSGSRSERGAAR